MSSKNCPVCSTPVTDDLPGGLCPACLMAAARKSNPNFDATQTQSGNTRIEPPNIPQLVNLFPELEILELIGIGGMGAVYKAKQKNLDRFVALKIFLFKHSDERVADRFRQEARALAKFSHQNIVTIHDVGEREDFHFLLMEFVDGPNLRQVFRTGELAPSDALKLVPQLCDALQYAHEKGIIHRDVKPENVLLLPDGTVKIADFGLAKITDQATELNLTNTRQVMGTFNYMAPEQRERPGEVDHRADIYSLGVVIYELLTGELPIGRFDPPSKRVTVDKRFDEVVMRALEKEPDRRYQRVSEFKTGMESVAHLAPNRIQPVPPIKSKYNPADEAKSKDESGIKTVPQMMYFALSMFVCCAGVVCLILADDDFLGKEMAHVGGRFLGLMVIMVGAYLFANQWFVHQILSPKKALKEKFVAAFGAMAMFFGVAGVCCFIASDNMDVFIPIPSNAQTEAEMIEEDLALERMRKQNPAVDVAASAAEARWKPRMRSVEDFKSYQRQNARVLRSCGVGLFMLCGFLFAVYGAMCSMIKNKDEPDSEHA